MRRLPRKHKKTVLITGLLGLLLIIILCAPYIVPNDPYLQDLTKALQPPSSQFPFGTDNFGRCVFSRVLVGGQITVLYTFVLLFCVSLLGTVIGITSGYLGGSIDAIIMRIVDILLSFPQLLLAVVLVALLSGGMQSVMIALGVTALGKYIRLARSKTLELKEATFVKAAIVSGDSWFTIVRTSLLPNSVDIIIVTVILDVGVMLCELAAFSFLGLGAKAPMIEWGVMLSDGRATMQTAPWMVLAPSLAIFIVVILCNLLGEALRNSFDVSKE